MVLRLPLQVTIGAVAGTTPATLSQICTFDSLAGFPGGAGHTDGPVNQARFSLPGFAAVDRIRNVFVADSGNGVIRRIGASGEVSTFVGFVGEIPGAKTYVSGTPALPPPLAAATP